jgi:hypothetical protein
MARHSARPLPGRSWSTRRRLDRSLRRLDRSLRRLVRHRLRPDRSRRRVDRHRRRVDRHRRRVDRSPDAVCAVRPGALDLGDASHCAARPAGRLLRRAPRPGRSVRCTANEPGARRDWQLDGRFPARFRQNRTLHCQCNRRPPRLAAGRMPSGLARQFDRAPLGPADSRRRDRLQTGEGAVAATRHRRSRDRWCRGRRQSVRCCVPRSCCSSRPCRRSFNFDWKDTSTATRRSAATTVASLRALHGYGPSTLRPRPGARPWQSAARPAGIGPEW